MNLGEAFRSSVSNLATHRLRSALTTKTLQDMGLEPVAHVTGGFGAWRDAGLPVGEYQKKH